MRPGDTLHASAVARGDRGLLILGPSGSGKSALAMALIGRAAELVADDRVIVTPADGRLRASPPERLAGLIEARGLGLLRLPHRASAPIALIADLDPQAPAERMPPLRRRRLFGVDCPLVFARYTESAVEALSLWLMGARFEDPEAAVETTAPRRAYRSGG